MTVFNSNKPKPTPTIKLITTTQYTSFNLSPFAGPLTKTNYDLKSYKSYKSW